MSSNKIYLYISDIAAYIGRNPYDYVTPFERLWKRCDAVGYSKALEASNNHVTMNTLELTKLQQEESQLKGDLENKKITKRQFVIKAKQIEATKTKVESSIKDVSQCIDDIDLTQKQKLEKAIGTNVVAEIQQANIETDDKRVKVNQIIQDLNIEQDKLQDLVKQAESFINKSHGTIKEDDAIKMYEEKFKVKLDTSQQFYKKKLDLPNSSYEWYVCGKMDGIYHNTDDEKKSYIVEVKNRTKGFFSTLRDYEAVQIQLYTWMLNFEKAQLVEKYKNKLRITAIQAQPEYVSDILEHLKIFIHNFESKFLAHPSTMEDYVMCHTDEKKLFLKKMYLEDIYSSVAQKIVNETDDEKCLINSDELD